MINDWSGNKYSVHTCNGNRNYATIERESNDYYATDPIAAIELIKLEPDLQNVWECACGEGHIAKVFSSEGKLGYASDLVNRGYGSHNIDFLSNNPFYWEGDIVTNPPYKFALEFVQKALDIIPIGRKVCMFLKLTFLEGKVRKTFFKQNPPKVVYVSSSRIKCAKNGEFLAVSSSAVAYAWFVWEKGYTGIPIIKWFN